LISVAHNLVGAVAQNRVGGNSFDINNTLGEQYAD
jgi:hypothetical protein